MPPLFLHAGDAAMLARIGAPVLAVLGASAAAIVTLLLFGWRGSMAAAAAGAVLLGAGLTGDLLLHSDREAERAMLISRMVLAPDPLTAARLRALEDAERNNPWHQVAVGGQGLLVTGLAGACFGLWRRERRDAHTELMLSAIERAAAWPRDHSGAASLRMPARYRRTIT
jgi:hypothetical protein